MKICIISPNFSEKAWMVSAVKTAECLSKANEVTVATSRVGDYPNHEHINGIDLYRLNTYFIPDPFNYAIVPGIFGWVWNHRNEFDIFIINKYMFFTSLTAIMLKLLGKRVIVQTDTFPGVNWKHPTSKMLNAFMWLYARTLGWLVLKSVDLVVILHKGNEHVCKEWKLNYKIIHNGVDFNKFVNAQPSEDIMNLKNPNKKVLVWIGRLDKIKGYQLFIDIANQAVLTNKIEPVMICGDKYPNKREMLQKQYPLIHFYGFRNDIENVLKASDIYILTSYDEGLPNTVMEAMASALPVISSTVGGVPYLLMGGKAGFMFSPGNAEEALVYLNYILKNPDAAKTYGKLGQEIIKAEYNLDLIANEWQEVLAE